MSTLDFPDSPVNGQKYSANGSTWIYKSDRGIWVSLWDSPNPWVRPVDWLPLPTITPGDQIFAGLFAVYDNEGNYVALKASGNYTVDWGDGSAPENVAAGIKAEHQFNYADVSGTVTINELTYRQAIITVVPQVGQNFTSLSLHQAHSGCGQSSGHPWDTPWLDWTVNSPNLSVLTVATNLPDASLVTVFNRTEQITVGENVIVTLEGEFGSYENLFRTHSLASFVSGDFPALTSVNKAWLYCRALRSWTGGNFPELINADSAWSNCLNLQTWVGDDFPALTSAINSWKECVALQSWTGGDFLALTNISEAWYDSLNLQTWTGGDFSAVTNLSNAWVYCYSLRSWTGGNFSAVTNLSAAWWNCYSLQSWTGGNFPALTDVSYAWNGCLILQSWIGGDFPALTNMNYAWFGCYALRSCVGGDFSAVTDAADPWLYCFSLQNITGPTGITADFSVANCQLGRAALVTIFNALGTAAKTITVTGNYGVVALTGPDLAIATDKGWTVVT